MNRTYDTDGGKVSLEFNHAMAQITFAAKCKLHNGTFPEVYIDQIKLSGLRNSNTVRFSETGYAWDAPTANGNTRISYTLITGGDLTTSVIPQYNMDEPTPNVISTTQGILCLLPQKIPGQTIRVKITTRIDGISWTSGIYLPAGEWLAGERYTYNLLLNVGVWDFGFTNTIEKFTAPVDGTYRPEAWGAQGGGLYEGSLGGPFTPGDYARGCITLTANQQLYVCVGSNGKKPGGGSGGFGARVSPPTTTPVQVVVRLLMCEPQT
jgi:hypothetical protein